MGQFVFYIFSHSLEKISLEAFIKPSIFGENAFTPTITFQPCYSITPDEDAHLSRTSLNMSSIGEVFNRLGKTFLTSPVRNRWATGGLRVNSTPDYNLSCVPARGEYNIADQT